jgi:hypothetical protein
MRTTLLSSILTLSASVIAQTGSVFEAADFNITEALILNNVNVSAIPELASYLERSLLSGCSTAVSQLYHPTDRRFNHPFSARHSVSSTVALSFSQKAPLPTMPSQTATGLPSKAPSTPAASSNRHRQSRFPLWYCCRGSHNAHSP